MNELRLKDFINVLKIQNFEIVLFKKRDCQMYINGKKINEIIKFLKFDEDFERFGVLRKYLVVFYLMIFVV